MGYRPNKKVYVLEFEDAAMNGLEVRARSAPLGDLVRVGEIAEGNIDNMTVQETTEIFRVFARSLVDWNIEDDDGNEVPPTLEGIYSLDRDFVMSIIVGWQTAIARVSAPLEKPSSNGETPNLEASLSMEALPSSPLN